MDNIEAKFMLIKSWLQKQGNYILIIDNMLGENNAGVFEALWDKFICIGTGLLEKCNFEDLINIIGHELGHLLLTNGTKSHLLNSSGLLFAKGSQEIEYRCDFFGCKYNGYESFATTLIKTTDHTIILNKYDTHPPLERRIQRLFQERYYAIE